MYLYVFTHLRVCVCAPFVTVVVFVCFPKSFRAVLFVFALKKNQLFRTIDRRVTRMKINRVTATIIFKKRIDVSCA